ncbi:MFS transporter [Nocardioides mangrovicus]|uniref:MFS transporter n=2 Tax=Nocardioides mangrovicus TaxID=2478913 RepID=A0A3L8NZR2_9ACTN|nr:MFS transporter [Nocardioides mangrovicus]
MVALVFLSAFEELAVTTVMPSVTADLDGRALYAVAFSATLAASIVGMVVAGAWADRRGPSRPLLTAVALFVLGLLVSGLAGEMSVFVAGRGLQGPGAGGLIVSLYVLVARVYAPVDHPMIFGAFAAAWVVPSMIGPSIAGAVAQVWSWHWVFLGVVMLALAAVGFVAPSLQATPQEQAPLRPGTGRRVALAVLVATGVAALDLVGHDRSGPLLLVGSVLALALVLLADRPLLPVGTLRLATGLPAVVAMRGVAMAAFAAADVYLPYLLQAHYGVAPWLSGMTLTLGAFGWAGSSQVQGRLGERLPDVRAMRIGAGLLLAGVGVAFIVVALQLPAFLVALAWISTGAGMGLVTSRASSFVLAASADGEQGSNSSAMTIADAVGSAISVAVAGIVFTALRGGAELGSFLGAIGFSAGLAALTVLATRRVAARTR